MPGRESGRRGRRNDEKRRKSRFITQSASVSEGVLASLGMTKKGGVEWRAEVD
jgi:hypothetical protein